MNSKVFIACLILVISAEARYKLNEKGTECAKKSIISEEALEAYELGQDITNYDTPEARDFMTCCYGEDYDGNNQLILNESTFDDIGGYYSGFIVGKNTLVHALAKDAAEHCKPFSGKSTMEESVYLTAICLLNRLREYDANCQ